MKTRASRYTLLFFGTVALTAAIGGVLIFGAGGFAAPQEPANSPWQIRAPFTPQLNAPTVEMTLTPNTKVTRALLEATKQNDVAGVETAFADGADANATVVYHYPNPANRKMPRPEPVRPFFTLIDPTDYDTNSTSAHQRAVAVFRAYLNHGLHLEAKSQDETEQTPLLWALFAEDDALVRELVARGVDVNAVSHSAFGGGNAVNAALHQAIRGKDEAALPLLRLFLEKRASPNEYDSDGLTPLHQAAFLGLPRCVAALLAHGANPSAKTRAPQRRIGDASWPVGSTPIQMAAILGNTDVMRVLAKATPKLSPVDAVTAGAATALKGALDRGAASANSKDSDGTPFLTLAVRSGDAATVRLLLQRGATVDARDNYGATALYEAAGLDQTEAARLLLAHHADPNAVRSTRSGSRTPRYTYDPYSPLTAAIASPSPSIVALLLKSGANVNDTRRGDVLAIAVVNAGDTPLHRKHKDPKRVLRGDALLEAQGTVFEQILAKADVRKNGGDALALAADRGQWGIAQALMERGANLNASLPREGSVLLITVKSIGMRRDDAAPDGLMMQNHSPEEKQEIRAAVSAENKQGMAFLRELLRRKPNVNEVMAKPDHEDTERTALAVARFWKMPDVEVLLKKAGARR